MRFVRILIYVLAALAGLYLLAAVLYAIPMVSGTLDDTMEVRFSRPDPSIVADYRNGLTPKQRETFYTLRRLFARPRQDRAARRMQYARHKNRPIPRDG